MIETKWYATVNNLIGGWVVNSVDVTLADNYILKTIMDGPDSGKMGEWVLGHVIADCNSEEDAKTIAACLNYLGIPPSNEFPKLIRVRNDK